MHAELYIKSFPSDVLGHGVDTLGSLDGSSMGTGQKPARTPSTNYIGILLFVISFLNIIICLFISLGIL